MLFVNLFLLAASAVAAYNDACFRSQEQTCGVQNNEPRHISSLIQRGHPVPKKSTLLAVSKKPLDNEDEEQDGFDMNTEDFEKSMMDELDVGDQANDEDIDKQLEAEVKAELRKMGVKDKKGKSRKKSKHTDDKMPSRGVLSWMADALGGSSSEKDKSEVIKEQMAEESAEIAASREREAVAQKKVAKLTNAATNAVDGMQVAKLKKAMNNAKEAKKELEKQAADVVASGGLVGQAPLQEAGVPVARGTAAMTDTTAVTEEMKDELAKQVADLKKEVTAQVAHAATKEMQKEFAKVHAGSSAKTKVTDSTKSTEKAKEDKKTTELAKELSNQIKQDRKAVVQEVAKQMKQLLPSTRDEEKQEKQTKEEKGKAGKTEETATVEKGKKKKKATKKEEKQTKEEKGKAGKTEETGKVEKGKKKKKVTKKEKDGKEEKGKENKKEKAQPKVSKESHKHVTHMVQQEMGMHKMGGSVDAKRADRPMTVEEALEFEAAQQENIQAKGTYEDRLNKKKMDTSAPKGAGKQDKKKGRRDEKKETEKKTEKTKEDSSRKGGKGPNHEGKQSPTGEAEYASEENSVDEDTPKDTSKENAKSTTYEDMLSKIKKDMYNGDNDGKKKAQADLEKLLDPEGEQGGATGEFDDLFGNEDKRKGSKKKGTGSDEESFAPAPPPDIPLSPGQNVTLDEEGYRIVLEQVSDPEMEIFIRRVIGELGLAVRDEGKFKGMVPYYSGRAANQTFNSLVGEITQAVARRCGWVGRLLDMDLDGSTAPLDERGYTEVAQLHSGTQMKKYITRVIDGMNYKVLDQAGLNKIIPAHSCEAETQTLQALRAEIKAAARQPGKSWVGWQRQQEEVS